MKKILSLVLLLVLILELSGCEAVQRKFTRKKKKEIVRPVFYEEGMADTRPNLELYMMHYMYWKTWHEDLVVKGGTNTKRDAMASTEIINHLNDMKKYLEEEKAKELDTYIGEIKKITDKIGTGKVTDIQIEFLKQKLDKIKGRVMRKFYYKKVREYIKPDKVLQN